MTISYTTALRNAQLDMLRQLRSGEASPAAASAIALAGRGANAPDEAPGLAPGSPYAWAAFSLSGDWR